MTMPNFLRLWTVLALTFGCSRASSLGKTFVTAFLQNDRIDVFKTHTLSLYFNTYYPMTTVSVSMNNVAIYNSQIQDISTSSIKVTIPPNTELSGVAVSSNVIVVKSDKDISVMSMNSKALGSDTTTVYPLDALGTEYYAVTPTEDGGLLLQRLSGGSKAFAVVSSEATSVTIYLKAAVTYLGVNYGPQKALTVTLSAYTAIQILSDDDLTGSRVVAQKPVAMLSGHTCIGRILLCNHIYEQLTPVPSWGTNFIVAPTVRTESDTAYIIASQSTNVQYYSDTGSKNLQTANLAAGGFLKIDVLAQKPVYITASAGIEVFFYGQGLADLIGQVFMAVPPVSSYCYSYSVSSINNYLNFGVIIALTLDTSKIQLNNSPLLDVIWNQVPGTAYSWTSKQLTLQLSIIVAPSPILLLSIGYSSNTISSYGSFGVCRDSTMKPSCNDVKCRAREKCQMVNGQPICVPLSEANCHVVGDPHYKSFDGLFSDFQGTCTYTIAKTCGNDSTLRNFSVEAKNDNRGNTKVSYVSNVTVKILGAQQNSQDFVINVVKNDIGFVKVNNKRQRLPLILNGTIQIFQSGNFLIIVTDFSLKVLYDWSSVLYVYISSSYFQNVCGMCGNYNENPSDDFATPSGTQAAKMADFGKSWKVDDGDNSCWNDCNGECKPCPPGLDKNFLDDNKCGIISAVSGPFKQCYPTIDPKTFVDNCVYDVCLNGGSKKILCESLATYASVCQRYNVTIGDWRALAGCPLQCPANSQYKLCGSPCNPTCNDAAIQPLSCSGPCIETCQCNNGFVLDGGKCIPKANCGCMFEGQYYAPNEIFWGDDKCQKQCVCNQTTKTVDCKITKCKPTETCTVVNGIQNCYPNSYGTCTVSTDPHFSTFDGVHYDFQGTCVYLLAGLCNDTGDLVNFQVYIQNENRANRLVSYPYEVGVTIYDLSVVISRNYPGKVMVNGILINLPFAVDEGIDRVSIYQSSSNTVLETRFGLKVSFNRDSWVAITVPGTYAGLLCGLCGNFNGDTKDEFVMKNGQVASSPTIFGKWWNVQTTPGCTEDDNPICPTKADLAQDYRSNRYGCGLLIDTTGPFRDCQAVVDPESSFNDCVFDVCLYNERQDVLCKAIASYVLSCQEAGAPVYPWRTDTFCSPVCPQNSHYEVCNSGCSPTCYSLLLSFDCNTLCSEGCQCDDGNILSGGDCVPISNCGCTYNGIYYQLSEVFYPGGSCSQKCVCTESGTVDCNNSTCRPNEECQVIDGVQKCQPVGSAHCYIAGDPHYMTFDGLAFDLQGYCTYTLSKTVTNSSHVVSFTINVKNEKWGNGYVTVTKLVSFDVYGYNLVLQYNVQSRIMINGVYYNIPVNLEDGKIRVYQYGIRVNIDTDFGVQVSYDLVYHLIVTVPGNYKNQLGGLCGNYNGNINDEFQLPDKTVTTDATVFGASWKVQIPGVTCDDGCGGSGNPCPPCDDKKKDILKMDSYCGYLKKVGGPLSACNNIINPDPYVINCVYDLCASLGDGDMLCQSIYGYVAVCQLAGVTLQSWRSNAFCPLTCPINSVYTLCANVCSIACAGINDPAKCPTTCSSGCECIDGFFFDGNNCVSMENCGCFTNGKYYKPNENVFSSDCKQICMCSLVGDLICEDTVCTADEDCMIQDGVVKCVNKNPCQTVTCRVMETCNVTNGIAVCVPNFTGTCWAWGDPHYHTFDGFNYDFEGTCTYILSKYDGTDTELVPFSIEEKNDNRGSQAVSYVRSVTIYMYGYKISIVKGEYGKVRVNDVLTNLPVTLLGGEISISISGMNVVVHTDFGLQVSYDYNWYVVVTLISSYYGLTGGLCGNFNQNTTDELTTSDNQLASSVIDWAASWKVDDQDPFCFDSCPGLDCPTCDDAQKNLYGGDNQCGLISKADGPFRECHPVVDPDYFFESCLYDVCINGGATPYLCQALNAYASICRKQGANVYDWRTPSGCVLPCPANSHYVFCGNACPATCTDRTAPSRCTLACVETCQCNDGFVLSGDKCVLISSCGCFYNGSYYQANQEFWADENCQVLCKCNPIIGIVGCQQSSCKATERCMITNGVRGCKPISFSTCTGSGDPHYTTFDGKRFDFMGTCIYLLVGVSSSDPSLTQFNLTVQNNNRGGNKAVSYTKVVTFTVYGTIFTLSLDYPGRILVNGVVTSLPFYFQTNKVVAYISGSQGVIKTDFDVTVIYDWNSYVAVTIPSYYANAVQGLCGNDNKNPNDDFNMQNGNLASNAVIFGNSWKVGDVAGCSPECTGNCPLCTDAQQQAYKGDNYCGLIINPSGPFGLCLSVIDPTPYFNDCIYDACQFKGHPSTYCYSIGLYVAACQAAGVKLQEWRTPTFCNMFCPINTHYELCGNACPVTCYGLSSSTVCDSLCKEACYCNNGFILSGSKCVPISDCGCVYQDTYYQKNQVFYPQGQCSPRCQCLANGIVNCQSVVCRPEEECKLVNGKWGCQPKETGTCVASGDPHYITFDGLRFNFQGTCTYILAKVVVDDPRLVNFSVVVENESYGDGRVSVTRLVVVYVYGYAVAIERGVRSKVKVNGELVKLPLSLEDGSIVVNQEGVNIILRTDFGLKVVYDLTYYVALSIPGSYGGAVGGLCGNFNGNNKDEFQLPDMQVVSNVNEFGASWKVNVTGAKCSDGCVEGVCPVCDDAELQRYSVVTSCGMITDPEGPFSACHAIVNPIDFFNDCTFDSCAVDGKDNILCKSLQAYAAACYSFGVTISPWRTSDFCPMTCPPNSHYENCTRDCEQTCASLVTPPMCTDSCFEGCVCDDEYVLNGDICDTADKCGCVYNGRYLSDGESFVNDDCSLQCKCQYGGVTCTAISCGDKERCGLVNGVRGCYKTEANCSLSPQNFVTFDGLSGGPIGNGPVEVISLCDRNSTGRFRVIADIQSCAEEPASVARLHIFQREGLVTISISKEVWVNGLLSVFPVTLGILSASATESSVSVQIGVDLTIELSSEGSVTIQVLESLSELICGACGDFDGDISDDLTSPTGEAVADIIELVKSWIARDFRIC